MLSGYVGTDQVSRMCVAVMALVKEGRGGDSGGGEEKNSHLQLVQHTEWTHAENRVTWEIAGHAGYSIRS